MSGRRPCFFRFVSWMRAKLRARITLALRNRGSMAACSRELPSPMFSSPIATADAGLVEALGDLRERTGLAVERVLPGAGLAGVGVDRAQVEVAGDVLQVASVLEPGTGGRDVVGCALALRLEQDREPLVVVPVPARTPRAAAARSGVDHDLHLGTVGGWRLEGVLARVEPGIGE